MDGFPFGDFPTELIIHVFEFLENRELFDLSLVCKRFKTITHEMLAERYVEEGRSMNHTIQTVIDFHSKAIKLKPNFAEAYFWRGFSKEGIDTQSAIQDWKIVLQITKKGSLFYVLARSALLEFEKRDMEKSAEVLEEALNQEQWTEKEKGLLYYMSNFVHYNIGRFDDAIDDLIQASQRSYSPSRVKHALGLRYKYLDQPKSCTQILEESIAIEPSCRVLVDYGRHLLDIKRKSEAKEAFELAVLIHPQYPHAYEELSRINHDDMVLLKKAIDLDRICESDFAVRLYAAILADSGKMPESIDFLTEKINDLSIKHYSRTHFLELRASLKAANGDPDGAIDDFRKVLRSSPLESRTQVKLAKELEKRGDYFEACQRFKNAIYLQPSEYTNLTIQRTRTHLTALEAKHLVKFKFFEGESEGLFKDLQEGPSCYLPHFQTNLFTLFLWSDNETVLGVAAKKYFHLIARWMKEEDEVGKKAQQCYDRLMSSAISRDAIKQKMTSEDDYL